MSNIFYGRSNGVDDTSTSSTAGNYVLNWRSCNVAKCNQYCDNPSSNPCFSTLSDPNASTVLQREVV
jgi:hypothetical protein